MPDDSAVRAVPQWLMAIHHDLERMRARLRTILSIGGLSEDDVIELTTIYCNVGETLTYLNGIGNSDYPAIIGWAESFMNSPDIGASAYLGLSGVRFADPVVDRERRAWAECFRQRSEEVEEEAADRLRGLYGSGENLLTQMQSDQSDLLRTLGLNQMTLSPTASLYQALKGAQSHHARSRIAQAWSNRRDRWTDQLVGTADRIIDEQRLRAQREGHATVVARTFRKCTISESRAEEFLRAYVRQSVRAHSALASEIRDATGCDDSPINHFEYYVGQLVERTALPLFSVDASLEFLCELARSAFDIDMVRDEPGDSNCITIDVRSGSRAVGKIHCHLVSAADVTVGGAEPAELRRPQMSGHGRTERAGHILCRVERAGRGSRLMNFETVHTLFRQFGKVLNYLLVRRLLPRGPGLEYLPLERAEELSTWFEKWAYHPEFPGHLGFAASATEGWVLCRRVKVLDFCCRELERAVIAAVDFDVHRRANGGLRESFGAVVEEFGISGSCSLADVAAHFVNASAGTNPGAGLTHLWGAAVGVAKFSAIMNKRMDEISWREGVQHMLRACIDSELPSAEPEIERVASFYEVMAARGRRGRAVTDVT